MAEETAFENGQISDFQALVTLTLTLDRVIPSCITRRPVAKYQISWKSKKHLWTDGHLRPTLLVDSEELRVDLKMETGHPLESKLGSEFLAIHNHC